MESNARSLERNIARDPQNKDLWQYYISAMKRLPDGFERYRDFLSKFPKNVISEVEIERLEQEILKDSSNKKIWESYIVSCFSAPLYLQDKYFQFVSKFPQTAVANFWPEHVDWDQTFRLPARKTNRKYAYNLAWGSNYLDFLSIFLFPSNNLKTANKKRVSISNKKRWGGMQSRVIAARSFWNRLLTGYSGQQTTNIIVFEPSADDLYVAFLRFYLKGPKAWGRIFFDWNVETGIPVSDLRMVPNIPIDPTDNDIGLYRAFEIENSTSLNGLIVDIGEFIKEAARDNIELKREFLKDRGASCIIR